MSWLWTNRIGKWFRSRIVLLALTFASSLATYPFANAAELNSDDGTLEIAGAAVELLRSSLACPLKSYRSEMNVEHEINSFDGDIQEFNVGINIYTISFAADFKDEYTAKTRISTKFYYLKSFSIWSNDKTYVNGNCSGCLWLRHRQGLSSQGQSNGFERSD